MKTAYAITVGLIIGVLSGVGVVHVTIAGDVKEHAVKISKLEKELDADRVRTDTRIYEVAGLVKEVISSNRELISLLKLQAELLREKKQ